MTLHFTPDQLCRLAIVLDHLLAPPEQVVEHLWAERSARAFGELFDDGDCAVLALDHGRGPHWFGPGRDRPDCRLITDPQRRPAGLLPRGDGPDALAWWYAGVAGADGTLLGAGLWWSDPGARLRLILAYRPDGRGLAGEPADADAHARSRALLELLRAPFAAAARARAAAVGAAIPTSEGRREHAAAAALASTSGSLSETLAARFGLTPREVDVTRLLLQGRPNTAVATELGISESTARHHTERIIGKLGVRSRAEVAWVAVGALATPPQGLASVPPAPRPRADGAGRRGTGGSTGGSAGGSAGGAGTRTPPEGAPTHRRARPAGPRPPA